jgi:putative SOS response-associated peptidase YedK
MEVMSYAERPRLVRSWNQMSGSGQRGSAYPTQSVPLIRQAAKAPKRIVALVRWGVIPYWAKDAPIGF